MYEFQQQKNVCNKADNAGHAVKMLVESLNQEG